MYYDDISRHVTVFLNIAEHIIYIYLLWYASHVISMCVIYGTLYMLMQVIYKDRLSLVVTCLNDTNLDSAWGISNVGCQSGEKANTRIMYQLMRRANMNQFIRRRNEIEFVVHFVAHRSLKCLQYDPHVVYQ